MQGLGCWVSLLLVAPAFAEEPDAGRTIEYRPANPGGADDPSQLLRSSGLPMSDVGAAADAGTKVPVDPVLDAGPLPEDEVHGRIGAVARLSYQRTSSFPADETGLPLTIAPLETRIRINPEVHFRGFGFVVEADAATGALAGTPDEEQVGARVPHPAFSALELRQLFVEYKWKTGAFRVGQQLSQWGLGILANAGAKDAEPGDFGQQHFGVTSYRALLVGRPLARFGGWFRAIEPAFAADLVVRDGNAEFVRGDKAFQAVFALRFVLDPDRNLGLYAVYRSQRLSGSTDDARSTDVVAIDVAGRWTFSRTDFRAFNLGFEWVGVTGTTTLGRTAANPQLQVRQFGAAVKASYRRGSAQLYLDWGYASGDQNPGDDRVENFRFDRDYKVGLVLFDEVLGYQSARSAQRAADPTLFGLPPEGVEHSATGGSVTSAWYLFPRLRYGLCDWLDVYGGPLFAFSTARLTDPFNSSLRGGTAINYLGGKPGNYLGTELDLGVQARWQAMDLLLISATLEAGLLVPGDAFRMASGAVMGPVGMGRLRLAANL
jgi:hypothetical protein